MNAAKTCPACKVEKPSDAFGVDAKRCDGRCSTCKECRAAKAKAAYAANPSGQKARSRARYLANREKVIQRSVARNKGSKIWLRDDQREKAKARAAKYNARNREKIKARQAVSDAVKLGRITRPDSCSRCGSVPGPKSNGSSGIEFSHSNGYDEPNWLVGEWLCRACHMLKDRGVSHAHEGGP